MKNLIIYLLFLSAIPVLAQEPALPVEWLHTSAAFNASNVVEVNFSTASQKNCKAFEIERMTSENRIWLEIGNIAGAGTTNERLDYKLIDSNVVGGVTYYYRIKQVDYDGAYEYTGIMACILSWAKEATRYYDIMGREVLNPLQNQVYFQNIGNETRLIIYK